MNNYFAFCAALSFALTGCGVVRSTPGPIGAQSKGTAVGSYQLAKHVLTIAVPPTDKLNVIRSIDVTTTAVPDQDPSATVHTSLDLSTFADDTITVKTTSAGLLDDIDSANDDKTGEILTEIGRIAGAFQDGEAGGSGDKIKLAMDPFNPYESNQVNKAFKQWAGKDSCIEVEVEPGLFSPGCGALSLGKIITKGTYYPVSTASNLPADNGIYFRRPIAHRVHIVVKGKTVLIENRLFANLGQIGRVDVDRSAFVNRKTKISFTDGVPTLITVTKPSEALAVAKLPVGIFDAYIGGVLNTITKRDSIIAARTKSLQAKALLIEAEAALKKKELEGQPQPEAPLTAPTKILTGAAEATRPQVPDQPPLQTGTSTQSQSAGDICRAKAKTSDDYQVCMEGM